MQSAVAKKSNYNRKGFHKKAGNSCAKLSPA
jgi:hypothetical protein